jgi:hypothetical protein
VLIKRGWREQQLGSSRVGVRIERGREREREREREGECGREREGRE